MLPLSDSELRARRREARRQHPRAATAAFLDQLGEGIPDGARRAVERAWSLPMGGRPPAPGSRFVTAEYLIASIRDVMGELGSTGHAPTQRAVALGLLPGEPEPDRRLRRHLHAHGLTWAAVVEAITPASTSTSTST